MIHIVITRNDDNYVAACDGACYVGGSPDEALGYAIRGLLLSRGEHRTDGSLVFPDVLRVSLLKE